MIRTYTDLARLRTYEERYRYLKLAGSVGSSTFGFDRYLNQQFYRSSEWRRIRSDIIARDEACDLGIRDREIYGQILVHHMNPITPDNFSNDFDEILNPEFLICTTHATHNAIHYGDESLLILPAPERRFGDTFEWPSIRRR